MCAQSIIGLIFGQTTRVVFRKYTLESSLDHALTTFIKKFVFYFQLYKSIMSETNRRMIFLTDDDVPVAKLKQPPSKCIIPELKRWLECHNEKKGLKAELVERVERCILLKKKVDPKVDGGKWYRLKAAETVSTPTEQAQTSAQASVPPLRQGVWKKWPSRNLPQMFNYGHVYRFPVESVSGMIIEDSNENEAAEDTTTEKPLRKGDRLWKSEFIDYVHDNEDNRGLLCASTCSSLDEK